jgi:GPH family glycoside/pentoside/hexuronide:cation symporter
MGDGPGSVVPDERISSLLGILRGKTTWIKIGGSTGAMTNVPRIAHSMGFKVAATAYLNGDANTETAEIHQLEANVMAGYVDLALVGSEAVWIKVKTADALGALMDQVRGDIGRRVSVGTTEPDQAWFDNPGLAQHADLVVANITPFSFHVSYDRSMGWLQDRYGRLQRQTGKPVFIGETEWATDGGYFNPGGPTANLYYATRYFANVEHWARPNHVIVFYFEAFDEPWLSKADSVFGPHWGVFTSQGAMKPGMEGGFQTP